MKLSVLFVRPSNGATMHRALASLSGAAGEAVKFTGIPMDIDAFIRACQMQQIKDLVPDGPLSKHLDDIDTYNALLPSKFCSGIILPSNLSEAVNTAMKGATGEYILLMSPSEVCLDPLNIPRTIEYLDTKPQLSVVSCPIKIYSDGEHVKTVMMPKLIRRSSVEMTSLLADNWFPCNDQNWLINASGLEFMDHGDSDVNQGLVDFKICLVDHLYKSARGLVPRENILALAERAIPWNAELAVRLVSDIRSKYTKGSTESSPMLIIASRANLAAKNYSEAIEDADEAIAILPSAAAFMARGFASCGISRGWEDDLRRAAEISRETTSYGLDLRELRLANLMVRWRDNPSSRCLSNHGNGLDIPCLVEVGHDGKHLGIYQGARVSWETEETCLDCGAPILGGHGDCQNT